MSNQLFNCAECQKTITKCLEYSHLKKNNTRICGDCMRFCKSQVGTHFDTWKNLIDKNCFKCDRYIPPKRCYLFRNLWSTKEGEKVFCDDCAIESHNESTIDSRWKTPSQKLEGVKDAVRIRSEHERRGDCLDCHPNAKTCPQCQNTFTDKGSTCKDCGKVFCSCCCMSRALKCKEQPKEYKHDHDYKPIKHNNYETEIHRQSLKEFIEKKHWMEIRLLEDEKELLGKCDYNKGWSKEQQLTAIRESINGWENKIQYEKKFFNKLDVEHYGNDYEVQIHEKYLRECQEKKHFFELRLIEEKNCQHYPKRGEVMESIKQSIREWEAKIQYEKDWLAKRGKILPGSNNNKQKNIKFEIKSENKKSSPPPFSNNECLTIELKNIKSITLTQGNLVIEFDKSKVDNYQPITQIVTSEQLSQSQELQKIRDFCQKNNKNSLNKQELNNIFKDELSSSKEKEPNSKNNNLLLVGGLFTIFLMIILGIRFILFKKRMKYKK